VLVWGDKSVRKQKREEIANGLAMDIGWLLNTLSGRNGTEITYMGDPSVASAELGEAIRRLMVEDCLAVVEKVAKGEMRVEEVRHHFLSVMSIPVPAGWHSATVLAAVVIMLRGRRQHAQILRSDMELAQRGLTLPILTLIVFVLSGRPRPSLCHTSTHIGPSFPMPLPFSPP
jgi:hypothetical protein